MRAAHLELVKAKDSGFLGEVSGYWRNDILNPVPSVGNSHLVHAFVYVDHEGMEVNAPFSKLVHCLGRKGIVE